MKAGIAFALTLIGAYVVTARGVGNLFPISTFEMYGRSTPGSASRIIVRRSDGSLAEVTDFEAFDCATEVSADPMTCLDAWPFEHVPAEDEGAVAHVQEAAARLDDGEEVEVVRRVWRLRDETVPHAEDCTLARCSVR